MKSTCRTWISRTAAALSLCAGLPYAASQGLTPLSYSTYFGGNGTDAATAVAVDSVGNAYVTGWTASTSLPVKSARR